MVVQSRGLRARLAELAGLPLEDLEGVRVLPPQAGALALAVVSHPCVVVADGCLDGLFVLFFGTPYDLDEVVLAFGKANDFIDGIFRHVVHAVCAGGLIDTPARLHAPGVVENPLQHKLLIPRTFALPELIQHVPQLIAGAAEQNLLEPRRNFGRLSEGLSDFSGRQSEFLRQHFVSSRCGLNWSRHFSFPPELFIFETERIPVPSEKYASIILHKCQLYCKTQS